MRKLCLFAITMLSAVICLVSVAASEEARHGIAMHGETALPEGFAHRPYANPDAPKGGRIVYGVQGTFDSVNPFILKGAKVRGLRDSLYGNNVYESLLARSRDEPFALYGLLAEKVIMPEDRAFIEFIMNPNARFSDGMPVTVDDVIFTIDLLVEKGRPNYRSYYARVDRVERRADNAIRIHFNDEADRELPLILALMPILPKHAIDPDTFDNTTLIPIIGSGPYILTEVDQGSRITLTRNPDYWAKDLPIKRGFDNFDEIRIEYYRDGNALFEAFKKGLVDVYFEGDPTRWKDGYTGRAVEDGRIVRSEFESGTPRGMRGYAFNTRRKPFNNKTVRKALAMLFDFEWINKNLFNDSYARSASFFQGSELSALGVAASERERALLSPFSDSVEDAVMDGSYRPPETDGSGRDRTMLREALNLLTSQGFRLSDGVLLDPDGAPFVIDLLLPAGGQNRVASAYAQTMRALGIRLVERGVDAAQFEERRKSFDFDMIAWTWGASLSPGNEQNFRWSSAAADRQGSFNFSGVKNPAIDAMIDAMLAARKRTDFVDAVRAYDRLLMSGHYVVPLYHLDKQLIAHSSAIAQPRTTSLYGAQPSTWWHQEATQ